MSPLWIVMFVMLCISIGLATGSIIMEILYRADSQLQRVLLITLTILAVAAFSAVLFGLFSKILTAPEWALITEGSDLRGVSPVSVLNDLVG